MPGLLAIIALLSLTTVAVVETRPVHINLFSLFRPHTLHIYLASGTGARVDTGRLDGGFDLAPGEHARINLVGGHLSIVPVDSYGRDKPSISCERARIIPRSGATFELVLPDKMRRLVRGELMVQPREAKPRDWLGITLGSDLESVVASVVAAELHGSREPEAFKALAVVARTFMLSHAGRHREEGFDFCDTTHCQLYKGEAGLASDLAAPILAQAVAQTAGEALSFEGHTINTYFTAVCGGLSATPEMVWGGSLEGGYRYERVRCRWCAGSHYMKWERRADAAQVLDALSQARGIRLSSSAEITIEEEEQGGPVRRVIIRDKSRQVVMGTEEFRRAIGLRIGWNRVLSPTFQVERRGRHLIFRGRGFGSQVGLCLAGTRAQAAAGRSYRDILEFYYPRAEIGSRAAGEK
ncbi:MAG TPA: SpoIID/LytB domain-containing protein [Blastocatellia bacterium]|nr:SpoIID/LytB domain-containing protein [Blastocatellia bacterium]